MTQIPKLGKLEKVDLRNIWQTEAGDFTPWLAEEENIQILSDAIGIDLEVEATERNVGPFRADILCKDTASNDWVLVENQLEKTDHIHLGQLMTYASGLDTVTIIWIAAKIRDEHRAALDWLNDITNDDFKFFGLEVELWKIGQSAVAPKFNIVSKPNDWTKSIVQSAKSAEKSAMTPAKQLQIEFWNGFTEYVESNESPFRTTKPLPQHWMNISVGRTGFKLNAICSLWDSKSASYDHHEIRAELELTDENSKVYFDLLAEDRDAIEAELGEPLAWHEKENVRSRRIYLQNTVDLNDKERWSEYFGWLHSKLSSMHNTFSKRIKQLNA